MARRNVLDSCGRVVISLVGVGVWAQGDLGFQGDR